MSLEHRSDAGIEIVRLSGSFDAAEAPKVREELSRLCESTDARFVIDLAQVQFIDSSGLSVLVSTLKTARAKGGDVVLCSLTPPVRSIVELTRLHRILDICEDEATAIIKITK